MTTPYDDFVTWFNGTPGADGFVRARGRWRDTPDTLQKRFVVFEFQSGGKPDVDRISPVVSVLILGKQGESAVAGAFPELEKFAYSLVQRSMSSACCGKITGIRAISTPMGPGFTTEDRPWYSLSLELTGFSFDE